MKIIKVLVCLGFLIPFLIIFRNLFTSGPLVWGDAPYFYPENLVELFHYPLTWDSRNDNFGTDQSDVLWLYLPTFFFGLFNHLFNLSSDVLMKLIFLFPAAVLPFWGTYLVLGLFTNNIWGRFLGAFFYSFNNYNLLLIDGGQVGVALSYGLFPLVFYWLSKGTEIGSPGYLLSGLFGLVMITNVDIRVSAILVGTYTVYSLLNCIINNKFSRIKTVLFRFSILLILALGIDSFWLIPLLASLKEIHPQSLNAAQISFINLLDSFTLFQPHFPLNEFGKLFPVPFYFGLLPSVLFASLVGKSKEKTFYLWGALFLVFVFLSKGENDPFGEVYKILSSNSILGVAFRDSSKFFTPAFFAGSVLLAGSIQYMQSMFKFKILIGGLILLFLSLLIYPAFLGQLTGILGPHDYSAYRQIYQKLNRQTGFFRTLWFPETQPMSFSVWDKPAVSADQLYQEKPFAAMIRGDYDTFYFLHDPNADQWYRLLGIKYVFFPDDQRKKTWTGKELAERKGFLQFVSTSSGLIKSNLTSSFDNYQVANSEPHVFAQDKALFVVGGQDIYQDLFHLPDFSLVNQGFVFLEDGKFDPNILFKVDPRSAYLVFNKTGSLDLRMSFLQNEFLTPDSLVVNQWKQYKPDGYLTWKAQALEHGVETLDLDYNRSVFYSSEPKEELRFKLNNNPGTYYLAVRSSQARNSSGLRVSLDNQNFQIGSHDPAHFQWTVVGPLKLNGSKPNLIIKNLGGFVIVNAVTLVSEGEFEQAGGLAVRLSNRFPNIRISSPSDWRKYDSLLPKHTLSVSYQQVDPAKYIVSLPRPASWLVFTDHFDQNWDLGPRDLVLPFYSMVNGFYVANLPENQTQYLFFARQSNLSLYILLSMAFLSLAVVLILVIKVVPTNGKNIAGNP